MDLRDLLAVDRTRLANERTLLAYIRTGLTFVIAGFSLVKFFDSTSLAILGVVMVPLGLATFAIGALSYRRAIRHLDMQKQQYSSPAQ